MAVEYGVFNSEGCIDAGLWSRAEAEQSAEAERAAGGGDRVYISEMCIAHRDDEQPAHGCELCAAELAGDRLDDDELDDE